MSVFKYAVFLGLAAASLARADVPAVHGMLLFGAKSGTYASHLPMFHPPHDRQLILKVSLQSVPRSRTLESYQAAQAQGKTLFTLVPQAMDLEAIANGSKTVFSAVIYDGHFERGGKSLGPIQVKVDKVVFSSKLDPKAEPKVGRYLVFGSQGEYFAAHLIQGQPSFDAILSVSRPYQYFVPQCRSRDCGEVIHELIPDEKLPLTLFGPAAAQQLEDSSSLPSLGWARLG
jgi:hypothetical protein